MWRYTPQIQDLAAAASGERQQADYGDGLPVIGPHERRAPGRAMPSCPYRGTGDVVRRVPPDAKTVRAAPA